MTIETTTLADLSATPTERVFSDDPPTVRLSLAEGESIPEHFHPGRTIVVTVLAGTLALTVGDETAVAEDGTVARFAGDEGVALEARTDATAVLVLAPGEPDAGE